MKITLRLIKILLILLGSAAVFIPIVLYRPDLFPFQPSFGNNVVPVAMMVTAWTTLYLAYTAFRTIENSNEQEKHRREEDLLKETRERKERWLNEIIEWATQILICGRDITAEKFTRHFTTDKAELIEKRQRYNILTWRGVKIENIAKDVDPQLYEVILIAITRINQHIRVLDLLWYGKVKHRAAIGRHRNKLDDCAERIIEIAIKLSSNF